MTKPSVFMNPFTIEAPSGKKVIVNPIFSYAPDRSDSEWDKFYGQMVDIAAELDECRTFIESEFNPAEFLKALKAKGYRVYFKEKP